MAATPAHEGLTRRLSFRRSLADAGLSTDYLEALEQKRKTLDDSIHKYIASKEREYKQFEKDLKHKAKHAQVKDTQAIAQNTDEQQGRAFLASTSGAPTSATNVSLRRNSKEETDHREANRKGYDAGETADGTADATHTTSARLGHRANNDREKELAGVFTPQYLSALESTTTGRLERTQSETMTATSNTAHHDTLDAQRTNSDSAVQLTPMRPSHLHLIQRTSSSGSSVDGRLISAMKSQTEPTRPSGKRVSLAVGDAIVAPSDSVPVSLSVISSSSHSRPRHIAKEHASQTGAAAETAVKAEAKDSEVVKTLSDVTEAQHGSTPHTTEKSELLPETHVKSATTPSTTAASPADRQRTNTTSSADDDLDEIWDLDDSDYDDSKNKDADGFATDEEDDTGLSGRIGTPQDRPFQEDDTQPGEPPPDSDDQIEEELRLEFRKTPTSPTQTGRLGFRRPSVTMDPIYAGMDYVRAGQTGDGNQFYGSSFSRPASKGSFTGGSLGESYMARHAEEMMKLRSPHASQVNQTRQVSHVQ